MKRIFALSVLLLLCGCGPEDDWVQERHQRCSILGGSGLYIHSTKLFECFGPAKPFTFKLEFNKEVEYKAPARAKLFEDRYWPK